MSSAATAIAATAEQLWDGGCSSDLCFPVDSGRFRIEQPVYINIIRDPISRFLSNYFFRRFGDWRGEQNHLIRTPGMKDEERYLVRLKLSIIKFGLSLFYSSIFFCSCFSLSVLAARLIPDSSLYGRNVCLTVIVLVVLTRSSSETVLFSNLHRHRIIFKLRSSCFEDIREVL